ncbi:hypothetical protein KFK09_019965 [Dendrobium nobile]|uniref:Uncharacterized protein n=1 Tax=Dendrobium nobile TaxID=94219 RepID=A0A8T3ASP8_DENNO|nr:hypothetical protein KFK09_019965 [Dendrobium nobile]
MSTLVSMEGDNIEPANIEIERQDDHLHSYVGSQTMNENNIHNDDNEIDEEVEKWTNENQVDDIEEVEDVIGRNKRKKRSKVWDEFKKVSLPIGHVYIVKNNYLLELLVQQHNLKDIWTDVLLGFVPSC